MDLKKILKEQGLTDEQVSAVLSAMKENKIFLSAAEDADAALKKLGEENGKLKTENETLKKGGMDGTSAAEEIRNLKEVIQKSKIETAAIIALTKEHAADVDYLMYRAEKTGTLGRLKVDGDGKVEGTEEFVAELKKTCSAQFESGEEKNGQALVRTGVKRLEQAEDVTEEPMTLEEAIAQRISGEEE